MKHSADKISLRNYITTNHLKSMPYMVTADNLSDIASDIACFYSAHFFSFSGYSEPFLMNMISTTLPFPFEHVNVCCKLPFCVYLVFVTCTPQRHTRTHKTTLRDIDGGHTKTSIIIIGISCTHHFANGSVQKNHKEL